MALRRSNHTRGRGQAAALAATALLTAAASGCLGGGGSTTTGGGGQAAGDFIRQVTTQFSRGQSGRLWDSLHPVDQSVVGRARYMACQSNSGFDLQKFKVLETYDDEAVVAGKATPATAVSVQVTSDDGVTTATMHAVKLGGKWRWILPAKDYAAYKNGKCPASERSG